MRSRIVVVVAIAVAGAAVAGCSDSSAQPATIPPTSVPSATLPPVTVAESTTTVTPATSTSTSTATTVVAPGVVGLSADGPWKLVDSAPGVTSPGLVYELMPKLWAFLPTEESTDDGNLFVPSPADIPIIEAYLQATLVYFRAVTTNPINLDDPGWAMYYADGGESYFRVLRAKQADGQMVDLDLGVVVRPRVIGDERSNDAAVVFDCTLDGSVWRYRDGRLAPGSTPGVIDSGFSSQLVRDGTHWISLGIGSQADACI